LVACPRRQDSISLADERGAWTLRPSAGRWEQNGSGYRFWSDLFWASVSWSSRRA